MALSLRHQTAAQLAARFWMKVDLALAAGDKVRLAQLVWMIYDRIQAGDFTSDQVRLSYNAFYSKNLNTTQWNNLVTNTIKPLRDRYQAILDQGPI